MILPALLFTQTPAPQAPATQAPATQTPAAPSFAERLKAAGSRDILELPDGMTLIEERTLPKDVYQSNVEGSQSIRSNINPSGPGLSDMSEKGERGMRLIAVTLAPKEKLVARLTTLDTTKLQIGFAVPSQPGPMTDQIMMANRKPAELRARSLEIKNIIDQPFTVLVRVAGNIGYGYKLGFQRSK